MARVAVLSSRANSSMGRGALLAQPAGITSFQPLTDLERGVDMELPVHALLPSPRARSGRTAWTRYAGAGWQRSEELWLAMLAA